LSQGVALSAVVVAAAILVYAAWDARPDEHLPQLIFDQSVGDDLAALAEETWVRFLVVFRARSGCFGDVRLAATTELGSRAAYDPARAMVTVRVPGTAALLREALVHEWAHHVEFQCDQHQVFRPAFLAAVGLPPDTPWRLDDAPANVPASVWAGIPSEQYAEATVELVLDRRQIPTKIRVSREAVHAVAAWAAGN
jgi:hypothetical protein